jgi:Protein of unknown function (DUF3105)
VPKKQVSQDRKARIAEMQKIEAARENRTRIRIIAGCGVLLLALGGVIAFAVYDAQKQQPDTAITAIGVPASAASCDTPTTDKAHGTGDHAKPETTPKVAYTTVPPSTGPHYAQPAVGDDRKFYTAADRPAMEILVHNLEHGYTILWYDEQAGQAYDKAAGDGKKLADLAKVTNKVEAASGKFIVSAWDPSYGALPAGKKFALSHWSATVGTQQTAEANQSGHRQLCGDLSGEVVKSFVQQFPKTQSPEPDAA